MNNTVVYSSKDSHVTLLLYLKFILYLYAFCFGIDVFFQYVIDSKTTYI